jgi:hypothetical protein
MIQQGHNGGAVVTFPGSGIGLLRKFLPNESNGRYTLQQLVHTDRQQCRQCINFVVSQFFFDMDLVTKEGGINFVMDVVDERTMYILQFIQYDRMGANIVGGVEIAPIIRVKSDSLTIMSNANTPVLASCLDGLVPLLLSSSGVVQNVNQRFGYCVKIPDHHVLVQ